MELWLINRPLTKSGGVWVFDWPMDKTNRSLAFERRGDIVKREGWGYRIEIDCLQLKRREANIEGGSF